MATIKAGTYTMKEVLTIDVSGGLGDSVVTIKGVESGDMFFMNISNVSHSVTFHQYEPDVEDTTLYSDGVWNREEYREWTVLSDLSVGDEMYTWFTSNVYVAPSLKYIHLYREDNLPYKIYQASTDDEMTAIINNSEAAGCVVEFTGTGSSVYEEGRYYEMETAEPEGYKLSFAAGWDDETWAGPLYVYVNTVSEAYGGTRIGAVENQETTITIPKETPYVYLLYEWTNTVQEISGVTGDAEKINSYVLKLTGDATITRVLWCLTGDTLVTMADLTEKRLDEIEVGDYILSYNWETMQLTPNKVIYTNKDKNKTYTEYDLWTFDDGSFVKTVHKHRFFNIERKAFVYMDEWEIGEHTLKIDGTKPMLISHETVIETVNHYKITGELGTNYFANGLLTGDRYCPTIINFN